MSKSQDEVANAVGRLVSRVIKRLPPDVYREAVETVENVIDAVTEQVGNIVDEAEDVVL